jgi:hypothetical protein
MLASRIERSLHQAASIWSRCLGFFCPKNQIVDPQDGDALVNVKPDTLIRWQCKGFRLFSRWKSFQISVKPALENPVLILSFTAFLAAAMRTLT